MKEFVALSVLLLFTGNTIGLCTDAVTWCSSYQNYCFHPDVKTYCQNTCGECIRKCGVAERRKLKGAGIVIQGENAPVGFYPWQVAIYYDNNYLCGGALIDAQYIVSATHCFLFLDILNPVKFHVVLGDHDRDFNEGHEKTINVAKIMTHENFVSGTNENDVAILKLVKAVTLSDYITPICLPSVDEALDAGRKCYVSGWGKTVFDGTAVNLLQHVVLPIADRADCAHRNAFNSHKVTEEMICAGYNNGMTFSTACHGDSGGPLQCETESGVWKLYGVVSWGSSQCNGLDRYTVFTRISKYNSWINKHSS